MPHSYRPLEVMKTHGVEFTQTGPDQHAADCIFCGREDHFFVSPSTGMWDCKYCGRKGNVVTFITMRAAQVFRETHARDFALLEKNRGFPVEAFKPWKIGWDGEKWLLPCWSDTDTVRDIRTWIPGQGTHTTVSCQSQLYGLNWLATATPRSTVWVCEGEWDAIGLRWLMRLAKRPDYVVGVPGAGIFKNEWIRWFRNLNVILAYDNDSAGDDGTEKAQLALEQTAKSVRILHWPDARPTRWDIRDFVKDGRGKDISAPDAIAILESLLSDKPRHSISKLPADTAFSPEEATPDAVSATTETTTAEGSSSGKKPSSFAEVLSAFSKWVAVDEDFRNALAISLAVAISNEALGEPLWVYLVAPPSSGKTMILMSLQESERCVFRSTLTPASLISGFDRKPDPSLLPHLNGKTAVFKDGTELLAMHPEARRETYSVLRGAFDGHVSKSYGNGVDRNYPNLHFNMLVGVTPAIHGDEQATMGERFLKFEMRETYEQDEARILRAIENISKEVAMQEDLIAACNSFLERTLPETLPDIPPEVNLKMVSLSQVLSLLRAQVDRESYGDRDIRYRPFHEAGARVAKQLSKLGKMLAVVHDVPIVTPDIFKLLQRVAMDSSVGYHVDIVKAIYASKGGLSREEIARVTRIPSSTAFKRLQDLEQLGALDRKSVGKGHAFWTLSSRVAEMWGRATASNGVYAPSQPVQAFVAGKGGRRPAPPPKNAYTRF